MTLLERIALMYSKGYNKSLCKAISDLLVDQISLFPPATVVS